MTGSCTVAGRGGLTGCKGSKQEGHPSKDSDAGIQSTELAGIQRQSWAPEDFASSL